MVIAMESRLYTIQHNSLPVALVFYKKTERKIIDLAEWRMPIGLNVLSKVGLVNLGGN